MTEYTIDIEFSRLDGRGPELINGSIVLLAPVTVGVEDLANNLSSVYDTEVSFERAPAPIKYMNRRQDFIRIDVSGEKSEEFIHSFFDLYEDFLDASGYF